MTLATSIEVENNNLYDLLRSMGYSLRGMRRFVIKELKQHTNIYRMIFTDERWKNLLGEKKYAKIVEKFWRETVFDEVIRGKKLDYCPEKVGTEDVVPRDIFAEIIKRRQWEKNSWRSWHRYTEEKAIKSFYVGCEELINLYTEKLGCDVCELFIKWERIYPKYRTEPEAVIIMMAIYKRLPKEVARRRMKYLVEDVIPQLVIFDREMVTDFYGAFKANDVSRALKRRYRKKVEEHYSYFLGVPAGRVREFFKE